ncbi:MAG: response regulator [Gammaproteobacteria bacterium]|nr:response regulator [Gammaproteobacteria bacterium]
MKNNTMTKSVLEASLTKVLVVDDNIQFLDMLREVLVSNGYEVMHTTSSKDAENKFMEFVPDIVVTDIVMPEFDGIELMLKIRSINSNIRVIAISGGNSGYADTYLRMAKKLGADTILNKPFQMSTFIEQVQMLENQI